MMRKAIFRILLGTVLGLGLPGIFVAICQDREPEVPALPPVVQEEEEPTPEWRTPDQYVVRGRTAEVVETVTTIITQGESVTLTTVLPLTTTIYVPAGSVTTPLTLTLSSLAVPSFPPTPPWVVWGGRAFSLTAERDGAIVAASAISQPFTITVDFYGTEGYRWVLMHWVSPTWEMAGCGDVEMTGSNRIEVSICSRLGEFTVAASAEEMLLPIILNGASR